MSEYLGNYIHLHKFNYLRAGTEYPKGYDERGFANQTADPINEYQQIIENIHDNMKHKYFAGSAAQDETARKLSTLYSYVLYPQKYGDKIKLDYPEINPQGLLKASEQILKYIREQMPHININQDLSASGMSSVSKSSKFELRGWKETGTGWESSANAQKYIRAKTLQERLSHQMQDIKQDLVSYRDKVDKNKAEKFLSEWELLNTELSTLLAEAQQNNAGNIYLGDAPEKGRAKFFQTSNGVPINTLAKFNDFLKRILAVSTTDLGVIGEMYFAGITAVINGVAEDKIIQTIQDSLVGEFQAANKVSIGVEHTDLKMLEALGFTLQQEGEDFSIILKSSPQTCDISIDFSNLQEKTSDIVNSFNASVKNYSFIGDRGVSILSGAPLLTLLGSVNGEFGNHYLNILTKNSVTEREVVFPSLAQINKDAMTLFTYRALLGLRDDNNVGGNILSDYFIVNNQKVQKVYVFSTASLIDKIISSVHSDDDFLINNENTLPSSYLYMQKETTPDIRVAKILSRIHGYKISLRLNYEAFKGE